MSAASIVPRLCVMTTNCVRSVSSRSAWVNRPTFRSSSAASTSSRTQNGAGFTRRIARRSAVAVSARSPPDSCASELGRGERIHGLERDESATQPRERGERAAAIFLIAFVLELEGGRVGQRLILGQAELGAHLLLEQAQCSGGALLLDREFAALAA